MGYEPTLVVRKADLEKNRLKIESAEYLAQSLLITKPNEELEYSRRACAELIKAFKLGTVKFAEIELVIFKPDDSSILNKAVRDLMDDLGIDYRESI